jgi:calcium-dependent protein kinase
MGSVCNSTKDRKASNNEYVSERPREPMREEIKAKSAPAESRKNEENDGGDREKKYIVNDEGDLVINNQILIHKVTGTPLEKYEIVKSLGEGSFGKVFLVRHRESKLIRAMKEISKDDETNETDIQNEIDILKKLDHPHIVKIYEFFSYREKYYLITEYCKEGELFDQINKLHQFKEDAAAYILYQLVEAVNYCHKQSIVHRDLKPENILIENIDKNGMFFIKVIDFGTAKVFEKSKKERKLIGSCFYIAPEVIKKNYNEKCDLWSSGVILYILLCGQPPFSGQTDQETFEKITNSALSFRHKVFDKVSKEGIDLIKMLLDKNPKTRPAAEDVLNHPWFKKHKTKEKLTGLSDDRIKSFIGNLKEYRADYKLQQAAIAIIVHNIPHTEEIKELERAFRRIDKNGDGRLTRQELIEGFIEIQGQSNDEATNNVDRIFKNVDNDNNGYLEYEEFIRACIDKKKLLDDSYLKFAFSFFDADGSGQITIKELKEIFCGGGDVEVSGKVMKQILGNIDENGDGQISYEEFKKMMTDILG